MQAIIDEGNLGMEDEAPEELGFVAANSPDVADEWENVLPVFGYMLAHPERNFKKEGASTRQIRNLVFDEWAEGKDGAKTREHIDKMRRLADSPEIGETILAMREKIEATLSYIVTPLVGVDGRTYIEIGKGASLPEAGRDTYPSLWDHVVLGLIAEKYPEAIVFSKTVNPGISKRYVDRKFIELSADDFAERFSPESQNEEGLELCQYIWDGLNGNKRMFVAPVPAGELEGWVKGCNRFRHLGHRS